MAARPARIRPGRPGALPSTRPQPEPVMQPAAVAFPAYDFYTTEQLLEAYRAGPERLRAASAGLTMEQMRARPRPGKWSILEILLHVADSALLDDTMALFRLLRRVTGRIFTFAQGDDWAASAIHPDYGEITLRNLLELYADHSERHVEQILVCRRLLRSPLEMESLLPRRLY